MSPSTRRNLLIAVIAGALLLLAAAVVVLQAGPKRTETYLGPPDATAAHNPYFVLEKALLAAGQDARSQRYLRSLPETLQPTDTVVLAEHERGLNAAQRRGLRQFVANGGHLVLAVPGKAPTTLSPLLVDFGLQAAPACDRSTRQSCPLPVLAGDNPVLLEQPGHLRLRHGKGSLDLVDRLTPLTTGTRRRKAEHADVRSYHHDGLANPAHRELAARLLAPHWDAGGTFHLVHGQRQDRWWLLLLLQHWPVWLPLALLLAGLLWAASQRLGPLLPEPPPVRRSLREHLAASAAHLWRHGRGIVLYDAARADLQRQLALRAPALAGLHGLALEQALARHLRWPPDPVIQALSRPQAHDTRALQRRISLLMQMRNLL